MEVVQAGEVGAETPASGGGALFSRDGDGLVSDPLKVGATNGGIASSQKS
jgi:hypothetical protein